MSEQTKEQSARRQGRSTAILAMALCLALALVWLLLSGFIDNLLLLSLGAVSVAVSLALALRMGLVDGEGVPLRLGWRLFGYLPWLLLQVLRANLDVAWRVLQPDLPISPLILEAPASQRTDLGQVLYANSITLTPGTISVDLDPGIIQVHALAETLADDIRSGEMDRRVSAVEGQG